MFPPLLPQSIAPSIFIKHLNHPESPQSIQGQSKIMIKLESNENERIKRISVIIVKVTKCPVLISTGGAHGGGGDLAARLPLTLSTTPFSNVALTPPSPPICSLRRGGTWQWNDFRRKIERSWWSPCEVDPAFGFCANIWRIQFDFWRLANYWTALTFLQRMAGSQPLLFPSHLNLFFNEPCLVISM